MDRETDIESTGEKEIDELHDEQAIIAFGNSLFNISALPPEVLGYVFHWNVLPKSTFNAKLVKGSYNFLLVPPLG